MFSETIIGDATLGQIVAWLVLGALIGPFVGRLMARSKKGFGLLGNLLIGLIGAFVGGVLFELLDITWGTDVALTLNDFIAAFIGAVLLVLTVQVINSRR